MTEKIAAIAVRTMTKNENGDLVLIESPDQVLHGWSLYYRYDDHSFDPIHAGHAYPNRIAARAAARRLALTLPSNVPIEVDAWPGENAGKFGDVISIQLVPTGLVGNGDTQIQEEGADAGTEEYSVYFRYEDGRTELVDQIDHERHAVMLVKELCREMGVPLEPFPWQVGLLAPADPDIVVDDIAAFETFALKQPFIKDVQRYGPDDFNWPNEYGHSDTKKAKVIWDGAVAWTLAAMGHLGMPRAYLNGKQIRVVIEGRPGVGKTALAGLIHESMAYLGLSTTWSEEQQEKALQDQPWRDMLREFAPSIIIEERVITPTKAYSMLEAAKQIVNDTASMNPERLFEGNESDRRKRIESIVDLYVTKEMFMISPNDPDRQKKIAKLKVELCSYLMASGVPKEEKTEAIDDLLASREVASKLVDEANAKPTNFSVHITNEPEVGEDGVRKPSDEEYSINMDLTKLVRSGDHIDSALLEHRREVARRAVDLYMTDGFFIFQTYGKEPEKFITEYKDKLVEYLVSMPNPIGEQQ